MRSANRDLQTQSESKDSTEEQVPLEKPRRSHSTVICTDWVAQRQQRRDKVILNPQLHWARKSNRNRSAWSCWPRRSRPSGTSSHCWHVSYHCEVACRCATAWCYIWHSTTTTALRGTWRIIDCRRRRKRHVSLVAAWLWLLRHCSSFFAMNTSLYHGPTNRSRSSRAGCLSQCPSQWSFRPPEWGVDQPGRRARSTPCRRTFPRCRTTVRCQWWPCTGQSPQPGSVDRSSSFSIRGLTVWVLSHQRRDTFIVRPLMQLLVLVTCRLGTIHMYCYVMYCYVMYCYVMYCYVMYCYVICGYVMYCYVVCCDVMYCFVMYCDVLLCDVLLCDVLLCDLWLCDVMWCVVMWCIVLWCIVMYCDVMYWYAMYCYVMYCYCTTLHP